MSCRDEILVGDYKRIVLVEIRFDPRPQRAENLRADGYLITPGWRSWNFNLVLEHHIVPKDGFLPKKQALSLSNISHQ